MKIIGERQTVGTVSTLIFSCPIRELQNVEIYAVGALELGNSGVSIGTGIPFAAGESRTWTHQDFNMKDEDIRNSVIELYAVAAVATTAQVNVMRR